MPSWKKVIISGSSAELSSLYAPSITGSLQGTASYAETAAFSLATSETQILVINKSGATIAKGVVVHLTGSTNSSDTPYVTTASYESDNLSANTLGIAAETITFNSTGYVTTEGVLTGLDVTGLVAGQVVYLGATGSITGSAPIAPLHSVRLGQVVRDSPLNNGSIYVRIDNGYEIGELHDVIDTTTTASFGDLLVKSGSVWINSRQLTGSYAVTGSLIISASGATNDLRVGVNKLFVSASGNVGIGITTPSAKLHVNNIGTGNSFLVEDSANPDATPFTIDASGNTMIGTTSSFGILTVKGNGVTGVTMDMDTSSDTQSTRLFFKISGSGLDASIRNNNGNLLIGTRATANASSGTSAITISGSGDVGIGPGFAPSANRGAVLQVSGNISIETGDAYKQDGQNVIYIAKGTDSIYSSTIGGAGAGTTGSVLFRQTVYGYQAGALQSSSYQTAMGYQAGYGNIRDYQTTYGYKAGYLNSGATQTAVGLQAGYFNTGSFQTAIGADAGYLNSGSFQTAIGYGAGYANIGLYQTVVGRSAGYLNSGLYQTAIGGTAGYFNTGSNQTAIGFEAGYLNLGSDQTAIGVDAGYLNSGSYQTAIGSNAGARNTGSNQTAIGYSAGLRNLGSNQTAVGLFAGVDNSVSNQTAIGRDAGYKNSGVNQTAVGLQAGLYNTGSNQTAVGVNAGNQNAGNDNTNIGYQAGLYTIGTTNNTGSNQSVFLGSTTYAGGLNRTNQIVIGYNASGIGSNSVVLGNDSILTTALKGFVGIGITTPTASLHINNTSTSASFLVEDSTNPDGTPFVIDTNGNVGIGKTSPTSTLDVSGNTILSGSLTTTSSVAFTSYTSPTSFPGTPAGYLAFDSSGNIITDVGSSVNISNTNLTITSNAIRTLSHAGTSRFIITGSNSNSILELQSSTTGNGRGLYMQQLINAEPNRFAIRSTTAGGNNADSTTHNGWASDYILEYVSGSAVAPSRLKGWKWSYFNGINAYRDVLIISTSNAATISGSLTVTGGITGSGLLINGSASINGGLTITSPLAAYNTHTVNSFDFDIYQNTLNTGNVFRVNLWDGPGGIHIPVIDAGAYKLNTINPDASGTSLTSIDWKNRQLFDSDNSPSGPNVVLDWNTTKTVKVSGSLLVTGSANVIGDTTITGSLIVTDKIKGTSSHIDTNALIQASLLYLSNNF